MSWHVSQWDCLMTSWKKSHWSNCHTWNVGSNMNTYPGESSHLYHWCLLHWVSRGHPVSIPWGDCFPWICIVVIYIKFVFKTTFFRSKSWLWTWNTLQCASSSCPFAQVGITPLHIFIYEISCQWHARKKTLDLLQKNFFFLYHIIPVQWSRPLSSAGSATPPSPPGLFLPLDLCLSSSALDSLVLWW